MNNSELLNYIGNISQLGGTRMYELTEGWGRKMRAVDINTGSGLQYTVLPDRGMDISLASYKGKNLVYLTCNGETAPSYYEQEGIGWLYAFAGGLLTTCGLTNFGPPSVDEGENLGLHGRYSAIPVRQFADESGWVDGKYQIRLRGIAEEGHLFGYKLRMERQISSLIGKNEISIRDTISNFGNRPSPYTILYHINLGYPFLTERAKLIIHPENTVPRDKDAESGIDHFREFGKPQKVFNEQVFYHLMKADKLGTSCVSLINPDFGVKFNLNFNVKQLPYLTQWKMLGYGEYVLGLEPCNVEVKSRKQLRDEHKLPILDPGESALNILNISLENIGQE